MTKAEAKNEFGEDADTMCKNLCNLCTANDWYCPDDCNAIAWVRGHFDKAIEMLAKTDGDYVNLLRRARKR